MEFDFYITVKFFGRKKVREHLKSTSLTLQYNFPNSNLEIKEEWGFFKSKFHIAGSEFPTRESVSNFLKIWVNNIKKFDYES